MDNQQPQPKKPKGKMWKKILIILLIVIIVAGIAYSIYYLYQLSKVQRPSSNPEDDKVNMTIVNNIKNKYMLPPGIEEIGVITIVSWNTKQYGRIYGKMHEGTTDFSTTYFDKNGVEIGKCNAGPEYNYTKTGYSCDILDDFKYENADYK